MPTRRETPIKRVNPSGQVRWVARYTGRDGRRRSAGTFELRRQAQDAIDLAYQLPERRDTIRGYMPRWLEEHPVSERTMRTNRGRIGAVLDIELEGIMLGDWPMHELRRRHAKDLVGHMLTVQGRAPEGVRNILRALSALAEDASGDELADINPWRGVKVRDDDKRAVKRSREPRVWTFEEMHEFAGYAGAHEAMLRTMADCGPRVGELFAIRRKGLSLSDALLEIRGSAWEGRVVPTSAEKNHDRDVPIAPGCLTLLCAMPTRIDSEWLFPSARGRLWRYSNWHRRVWQPTLELANQPERVGQRGKRLDPLPSDFRHSWVTHLRAMRIDGADLADVAGHSEQTATAHYTHALRRSWDAIREAIG